MYRNNPNFSLTVKSSGSTIPVLRSITCNTYKAQSSHNANHGGEDYLINPQTWLTQPSENHINSATDILLSTTARRLAKDPFRISPWKANLNEFCFLNKTYYVMEMLMLELIKIEYHFYF